MSNQTTLCAIKVTLEDKYTGRTIVDNVECIHLNLDESVEDQIHDFFPHHNVLDFKWSEDLNAFGNTQDEEDEAEYNRLWQQEIAREAGAMYGMQAYHDHMGYSVEFDPEEDDCFACGGNGCGRCGY